MLYPDWLHVLTPDGRLQGVEDQTNKFFDVIEGKNVLPVDDRVMPFLKNENPAMEVFPMVNNNDGTDWVDIAGFLNDADARARFRREAGQFLSSGRYRGLMIDFEAFPAKGQPGYVALLQELSAGPACAGHEAVRCGASAQRRVRLSRGCSCRRRSRAHEL